MPQAQPTTLFSSRNRAGLRRAGLLLGLILGSLLGVVVLASAEVVAQSGRGWGSGVLSGVAVVFVPGLLCAFGLGLALPWLEERERGQHVKRVGKWVSGLGIEPLTCVSARLPGAERARGVLCLSAHGADFVWQGLQGTALLPLARGGWLGEERPIPEPAAGWLGRLERFERHEGRCWGYGGVEVFVSEGVEVERWAGEQPRAEGEVTFPASEWVPLAAPASEAGALAGLFQPWVLEGLGRGLGVSIVLETLSAVAVAVTASIGLAWLEGRARRVERVRRALLIPLFALAAALAATLTLAQTLFSYHAPQLGPRGALAQALYELSHWLPLSVGSEPGPILTIVWTGLAVLGLGLLRERRLFAFCMALWFVAVPLLAVAMVFAQSRAATMAIQVLAGVSLTFPFSLGVGRLLRAVHPWIQLALAGQLFMSFEPSETYALIKEGLKRPS
ncbi:MAG TPA: hypothetical protein DEA08_04990 [Planctomycetes bacterium]|nr:hypothetical protein [Planctomycetota bacterium]